MDAAPYQYQAWPAWATSPDGSESRVFDSEAEVPAGWTYPGGYVKYNNANKFSEPSNAGGVAVGDKDAAGTVFDPERHTGSKTKAGLWRMKVGVSRPESESQLITLDL